MVATGVTPINLNCSPAGKCNGGTFTVTNPTGAPITTSDVTVSFGNADLFASATITASVGDVVQSTAPVAPLSGGNSPEEKNATTFAFNLPFVIPAGATATYNLSAIMSNNPSISMRRPPMMYASMIPEDGPTGWGGLLAAMLLLSVGTTLVASSRPRRMFYVLVIVLLAMTSQVGCDNGSVSSSSGIATSTQRAKHVTAADHLGNQVVVGGLIPPIVLSRISVP